MNLLLSHCMEALFSSLLSLLPYIPPAFTVTQVCRLVDISLLIQVSLTSFLSFWSYYLRVSSQLLEPLRSCLGKGKGASKALSDRSLVKVRAQSKGTHCSKKESTVSPREILSSIWSKFFHKYNFLPCCREISGNR